MFVFLCYYVIVIQLHNVGELHQVCSLLLVFFYEFLAKLLDIIMYPGCLLLHIAIDLQISSISP